ELAIEMEDRQAHAVGDEAQPVLALTRLELEPLQVVDIAVRREEAADVSLLVAVGVEVDAHPDRRTAGRRQLPLVAGAFTAQRCVDVRAIELAVFATEHLDDLAAEHLVGPLAEPVEECLVDEPVALVAIDVRDRRPERIELALRKREQRTPL